MNYVLSALIAAIVTAAGLYLNRYWQLRQQARAENLNNYRQVKTLGYLLLEGTQGLFADEAATMTLREGLLEVGTAIHELDLSASPAVIGRFVALLREVERFNAALEQLIRNGTKVSQTDLNEMKTRLRTAYIKLLYAMRADAGLSNWRLKEADVEYLLLVRFGKGA